MCAASQEKVVFVELRVRRDGSDVEVSISSHIPTWEERVFPFSFNCGNEAYAGFLTKHIQDVIGNAVANARREAYEQGWKDAKAKRVKNDWFSRVLKS
jgi:hypothetical protein